MIKNCVCGLVRNANDSSFIVITGMKVDPVKGEMQVENLTMHACRGCGITYVDLKPQPKVVLAG